MILSIRRHIIHDVCVCLELLENSRPEGRFWDIAVFFINCHIFDEESVCVYSFPAALLVFDFCEIEKTHSEIGLLCQGWRPFELLEIPRPHAASLRMTENRGARTNRPCYGENYQDVLGQFLRSQATFSKNTCFCQTTSLFLWCQGYHEYSGTSVQKLHFCPESSRFLH